MAGIFTKARLALARLLAGDAIEQAADHRAMELVEEERRWRRFDEVLGPEWETGGITAAESVRSKRVQEQDTFADIADEDRGWTKAGDSALDISRSQLRRIQGQARFLFFRNPLARNIIRTYVAMIVGSGPTMHYVDAASQKVWDDFAKNVNWRRLVPSIVRDTLAMGELPMVLFGLSEDTVVLSPKAAAEDIIPQSARRRGRKDLVTSVRTFDARQIVDLLTDPHDYTRIIGLERQTRVGKHDNVVIRYGAEDVLVFRHDLVGSSVNGRTLYEPVMKALTWYSAFLRDRVILNGMRTRIPIIRKLERGGRDRVGTEAARFSSLPRPASVLTTGKGEEWVYPSLNLDGAQADPDARLLSLYIAAGVGLPEFMLSMRADTANKSSLQEAMDGLRPAIDELRTEFSDPLEDLSERVTGKRGELVWPTGERRESADQVRGYSIALSDAVMSRQTYASRLGLDWMGDEKNRLAVEQQILHDLGLAPISINVMPGEGSGVTADDTEDDTTDDAEDGTDGAAPAEE